METRKAKAAEHQNEEWVYAPVLIPTCNRDQHLKACLESLNNNKYADRTDVYVSVDYPPSEKYVAGHAAVMDYLESFRKNARFQNLYVYKQEKNLGVSDNFRFILQQAERNYDCYISTEDDNVFSSNFLEYCNACLRKFKNDERVYFICGYNDALTDSDHAESTADVLLKKYYEPYGTAAWRTRILEFQEWRTMDNIYAAALNFPKMMGLRRYNPSVFNLFVLGVLVSPMEPFVDAEGRLNDTDVMHSVFMYFNDKYAAYPAMNLTHSNGNDGSGVNVTTDCPDTRPISGESLSFDGELKTNVDLIPRKDQYNDQHSLMHGFKELKPIAEYIRWYWKNRRMRYK